MYAKKTDGQFVYSIQLNENKKIEASPSLGSPNGVLNRMLNASDNSIAQDSESVNSIFSNSIDDSMSNRSLLANALESVAASPMEKQKLAEYKAKIYGKIKKKSQWLRPSTFPDFNIKKVKMTTIDYILACFIDKMIIKMFSLTFQDIPRMR